MPVAHVIRAQAAPEYIAIDTLSWTGLWRSGPDSNCFAEQLVQHAESFAMARVSPGLCEHIAKQGADYLGLLTLITR